jgi:hypothetical protein
MPPQFEGGIVAAFGRELESIPQQNSCDGTIAPIGKAGRYRTMKPALLAVCTNANRIHRITLHQKTQDARIYTNDASTLGQRLSTDVSKSAAVDFRPTAQIKEPVERVYTWAEHERHYAPLNKALSPAEAAQFGWKAETGTIQTYQHAETNRNIHIDGSTGQFYNQARNPISREAALDHSMPANYAHTQPASVPQNSVQPSVSQSQPATDQNRGYSL